MPSPWQCLEEMPGLAASAAEWQRHLGGDFAVCKAAFLRRTTRHVASLPCPHDCGHAHDVRASRDGSFVGVCRGGDDDPACDDIPLTADDVAVWEVNLARLGRAIALALKCDAKDAKLGLDRTRQIASLGDAPLPIVLTIQHDEDGFGDVVAQLVARLPKGFILLAPTSRFCTAPATELLGKVNAGFFSLESLVTVLASGKLHASKSGGELFAAHLPEKREAIKESEGKRVFELFTKLATGKRIKKAPLETVFRHTVLKGHSQNKAAELCGCVPPLISRRVKTIESRFQMSIERLRNFASVILEMESSVKGQRTAKKKHGAPKDEAPQYDEGDRQEPKEDADGYLPEERPEYG